MAATRVSDEEVEGRRTDSPLILTGMSRIVPVARSRRSGRSRRGPVETVVSQLSALRGSLRQRRATTHASAAVPAALTAAGSEHPDEYTMLRSHHEVVLARGSIDGSDVVVRIPRSEAGSRSVEHHAYMSEQIHSMAPDAERASAVPPVQQRLEVDGRQCSVERFVAGTPVTDLDEEGRAAALEATSRITAQMQTETATPAVFDEQLAEELIDAPIHRLLELPGMNDDTEGLERLRLWLRGQLLGLPVTLCCTHGDLWAGNVLVADPAEPSRVAALVDWENGRLDGLGVVDDAHLWLCEQPGEIGATSLDAVSCPDQWPETTSSESGTTTVGPDGLPARAVIALAWLAHVGAGAGRTDERTPGRLWTRRNVLPLARAAMTPGHPAGIDTAGDHTPEPGAAEPGPSGSRRTRVVRADIWSIATAGLAAVLWAVGARTADPAAMTEFGLVSLMTPAMISALVLLSIGFVAALRRHAPGWVLGTYVVILIGLIHGTPAVLYETLRYSWSWKHAGIVEFILRNGTVDTSAENLPIYHSWPGMFAGTALFSDMGAASVIRVAMWAPVAFNLGNFLALRYLYRSLRIGRTAMWLALWLFFVTNWVGQDYFSPQAMAFLLYVFMIGTVLRGFRKPGRWSVGSGREVPRGAAFAVFAATMLAIASGHQITPFVAVVALGLLWLTRQLRGWYLPLIAAAMTLGWALTVGFGVTSEEFDSIVNSFGKPLSNAGETLSKASSTSDVQLLVSWAGRVVIVAVVLLAALGALKMLRRHRLDPALVTLAVSPAVMPLVTEFGGEVLFRVFLFAVPTMAVLGASALAPSTAQPDQGIAEGVSATAHRPWSIWRTTVVTMVLLALGTGFVVAYYGKDRQYYFSEDEIAAALWVADNSVDNTLLVEATTNYPSRSRNQELFVHVPISVEPEESWQAILADPAGRLERWLSNPDYDGGYVLITRGMKVDANVNGPFPAGSLQELEDALRRAPGFRVAFETPDGVVFELSEAAQ